MLGNLQMNLSLLRGREMDIEKDPNGLNQHDLGAKLDAGKPLPWLLISGFPTAIQEMASRSGWPEPLHGSIRTAHAAFSKR